MSNLESKISEQLAMFRKKKEDLPKTRRKLKALQERLGAMSLRENFQGYRTLKQQIEDLEKDIKDVESDESEVDYMFKIIPIIKDMHDTQECDQSVVPEIFSSMVQVSGKKEKGRLWAKYMDVVENDSSHYEPPPAEKVSHQCHCGGDLLVDEVASDLVCCECGSCAQYLGDTKANVTYNEEINLIFPTSFSYERMNHFAEWLAQTQGSETTDIPDEVISALKVELKKDRVRMTSEIKASKIKAYLKKLKLSKYYEHANYITNQLSGKPSLRFSTELEQRLKSMFMEIQAPFEQVCPPTRTNFLSYSYVLYKFCELIGCDEFLPYFQKLKSHAKLAQQDAIWKGICKILRWEYLETSNFH